MQIRQPKIFVFVFRVYILRCDGAPAYTVCSMMYYFVDDAQPRCKMLPNLNTMSECNTP